MQSIISIVTSEIDFVKAESMKKRFWKKNPNEKQGFWIKAADYEDFLSKAREAKSDLGREQKAIGIQPGHAAGSLFNLSIEVIFYSYLYGTEIPDPISIERKDKKYFPGRLASDFSKEHKIEEVMDYAVEIKDIVPSPEDYTKWIVVEFDELANFTRGVPYEEILVEFARIIDDKGKKDRLTVIFSRYNDGQIVPSPKPGGKEDEKVLGFYLDEHDLIP